MPRVGGGGPGWEGAGSNIDLPTPGAIDAEVRRRQQMIDEALETYAEAVDLCEVARELRDAGYDRYFAEEIRATDKVTVARERARARNREAEGRYSRAMAVKERAKVTLDARLSQLSAEQSRARLLTRQLDYDRTSG